MKLTFLKGHQKNQYRKMYQKQFPSHTEIKNTSSYKTFF